MVKLLKSSEYDIVITMVNLVSKRVYLILTYILELKTVDSIYFQFIFFFPLFLFWKLGLEFSMISHVTVTQLCVIIEDGRRF